MIKLFLAIILLVSCKQAPLHVLSNSDKMEKSRCYFKEIVYGEYSGKRDTLSVVFFDLESDSLKYYINTKYEFTINSITSIQEKAIVYNLIYVEKAQTENYFAPARVDADLVVLKQTDSLRIMYHSFQDKDRFQLLTSFYKNKGGYQNFSYCSNLVCDDKFSIAQFEF